jgi:hypothetical protein
MSYSDEFDKEAYIGDLYELTFEKAAQKIHEGLCDLGQATPQEIYQALVMAVEKNEIKTVRGSVNQIGKYSCNEAILEAFEVAKWAEKNGLDLEKDGAWSTYLFEEADLYSVLSDKLNSLRAQQRSGKSIVSVN